MNYFLLALIFFLFVFYYQEIMHLIRMKLNKEYKENFENFTKLINNPQYVIYYNLHSYFILNSKQLLGIIRQYCQKKSVIKLANINDEDVKIICRPKGDNDIVSLAYGKIHFQVYDNSGNYVYVEMDLDEAQFFWASFKNVLKDNCLNSVEYKGFHNALSNVYRIKKKELMPIIHNKAYVLEKLQKEKNKKSAKNAIDKEMMKVDPAGEILKNLK